jgi:hypothetical protein
MSFAFSLNSVVTVTSVGTANENSRGSSEGSGPPTVMYHQVSAFVWNKLVPSFLTFVGFVFV